MADYGSTIAEIRKLKSEIANMECGLLEIRSDIYSRGKEYRELCEYLLDVVNGQGGFEISTEQTALMLQAVRFTCGTMNVKGLQNKLQKKLAEQN